MPVYEIPLSPTPQQFSIDLGGATYQLTVKYHDVEMGGWFVDIADSAGTPIVNGIPLVTGCDLLGQYAYLGFNGKLMVQTSNDPDAVPTWENLGSQSHLYWVSDG